MAEKRRKAKEAKTASGMMGLSSYSSSSAAAATTGTSASTRPGAGSDVAKREAELRKQIMGRAGAHVPVGDSGSALTATTAVPGSSAAPETSSNTVSAWGDEAKEEQNVENEKLRVAKKILKANEKRSNQVPDERKIRNASASRALAQDGGGRRSDPTLAVSTAKRNTGYAIPVSSFGTDELDGAVGQARGL